jgi:uncharacterized protein YabN with tetrapyrrole methylase and pyrophosphatase domain
VNHASGSLAAVGIGIRSPGQTTFEVASRIKNADKVFTLVPNPLAEFWVRTLNANTQSLAGLYAVGKNRWQTYREVVECVTAAVRDGMRVCAVSYGHPGVAAYPFHESIRQLRAEGFAAEMLAGVSAEDSLFADLGVDPVTGGCLSYEATDFLLRHRVVDPTCNLILWQIGVIAESGYKQDWRAWNRDGLVVLTERLLEFYRFDHEAIVYEAPWILPCEPLIERVLLSRLVDAHISPLSTLFVPPMVRAPMHEPTAKRLGIQLQCLNSGAPSS